MRLGDGIVTLGSALVWSRMKVKSRRMIGFERPSLPRVSTIFGRYYRLRLIDAAEGRAVVGAADGDAVDRDDEFEPPHPASELAVGDGGQADLLLQADDQLDALVLDGAQRVGRDLALVETRACRMQALGPQ